MIKFCLGFSFDKMKNCISYRLGNLNKDPCGFTSTSIK